ncbi:MAG: hypothetical protein F6K35_28275 [Okeania sp. SIO2H7]|nr:hypothetical protein [Okeania sp. SIO2H7]
MLTIVIITSSDRLSNIPNFREHVSFVKNTQGNFNPIPNSPFPIPKKRQTFGHISNETAILI